MSWVEIVACVCLVEWGIIHIAAFFMMGIPAWSDNMSSTGVYAAADLLMAVPEYKAEYDRAVHPRLSGKVLWQHAFNLGWTGVWSAVVCPIYIANHNREAWAMTMARVFSTLVPLQCIATAMPRRIPAPHGSCRRSDYIHSSDPR